MLDQFALVGSNIEISWVWAKPGLPYIAPESYKSRIDAPKMTYA